MSRAKVVIQSMYWGGGLRSAYRAMLAGQSRNCPKVFPKCQESELLCVSTELIMVQVLVRWERNSHSTLEGQKKGGRGTANHPQQNKVNV